MPISFFVCSLPRSGSTWAANWLTTETSLCLHDPEASGMTLAEIDANAEKIGNGKRLGVATTSAWAQVDWLNAHPAPKLVIERGTPAVNRSLMMMKLPIMPLSYDVKLEAIEGFPIHFNHLFDPESARTAAQYLGLPFDADRHRVLSTFRVTPVGFR